MDVAVAAVVTAGAAIAGYIVTYFNNVRMAQREARLDRVNRQLGELYGPLLAISAANREAWLRREHAQGIIRAGLDRSNVDAEEQKRLPEDTFEEWRRWVTAVFLPGNRRLAELIISKADLLIDEEIPPCLTALCAHVAGWEVVMCRWEANDFSITSSVIDFPDDVNRYAHDAFSSLKQTQAALLGSDRAH